MHFADMAGLSEVHAKVREFRERFGPMYWEPPELLQRLAEEGGRFGDYVG